MVSFFLGVISGMLCIWAILGTRATILDNRARKRLKLHSKDLATPTYWMRDWDFDLWDAKTQEWFKLTVEKTAHPGSFMFPKHDLAPSDTEIQKLAAMRNTPSSLQMQLYNAAAQSQAGMQAHVLSGLAGNFYSDPTSTVGPFFTKEKK